MASTAGVPLERQQSPLGGLIIECSASSRAQRGRGGRRNALGEPVREQGPGVLSDFAATEPRVAMLQQGAQQGQRRAQLQELCAARASLRKHQKRPGNAMGRLRSRRTEQRVGDRAEDPSQARTEGAAQTSQWWTEQEVVRRMGQKGGAWRTRWHGLPKRARPGWHRKTTSAE